MSIFNPTAEAKSRIRFPEFLALERGHALALALLVVLTVAAFYPTLHNGFLDYDDDTLYLNNPWFRGLGPQQLRWMFTTFLMGHYQPLTWMTLGLDYVIWGMNPFGYHLTNLVLHAVNAILFYFLALRLISFAIPRGDDFAAGIGAAAAAIFFSIHPMRVESVAWLTERRDVLSGAFVLLTLNAYLAAAQAERPAVRKKWLALALAAYAASLLSKAVGMTLPVVFLILDVYPLRRLGGSRERWYGREVREVWLEKTPFFALAVVAAATAAIAQHDSHAMANLTQYGIAPRVAQIFYSFVFYFWKTIAPTGLLPMYEPGSDFNPFQTVYFACALFVIAATAALVFFRKAWPAGLAVWLSYLVMILPVSGIAQSGPQLVAVRYSYLSCLGFALLAGAGIAYVWRRWLAETSAITAVVATLALMIAGLTYLTRQQVWIWHDTESLWRYTLAVEPRSSVAHNDLGNILLKRGEATASIEEYRQAIRFKPKSGVYHFNLANVLVREGQIDEAIQEYRYAVYYAPYFARAYFNLAYHLTSKGKLDEAIDMYKRAVREDPSYSRAYNNLGRIFVGRGRLDEAVFNFRKAIEAQPDFALAYANLGHAFLLQGKFNEAARSVDRALQFNPSLPTAHYVKGMAFLQRKQFAEAIAEYQEAVAGDADYVSLEYEIGNAYFELGRFADAAAAYEKFLQTNPKHSIAHYNLGNALMKMGQSAAAADHYRASIELAPRFGQAYANLANALEMTGDRSGALRNYRRAIEVNPGYAPAHFNLANALWKGGELEQAIAEYRRAVEIKSDYVEARTNLGSVLDAAGKPEAAVEQYRRALKIDPQYVPAEFNLAVFLGEQGEVDAAVERLRRVVKLTPDDAEAHFHLGRYLAKRGELDAAAREFRQALKLQPELASAKQALTELPAGEGSR
ncbi:MAG TPA: tetratricopeptide repeat protein [Verrucomicrobiae bacterium]|nr:tetratricopeptide repeat protein [Verrucomicrobiae bacterium]